jgi:hypothetical protein
MKWFILTLVVEADNFHEAELFTEDLIQSNSGCNELWGKHVEEMNDKEILEFFDKPKEQMQKGNIE